MESVDGLPIGSLDLFHKYRLKSYKHLYYCYRCARTFDTKEPASMCKFCNAAVRDISGAKFEQPLAQKYRYYCEKCEKNFESYTIFENCALCGSKIVHIYKWEQLSTQDKITLRLKKMFRGQKESGGTKIDRKHILSFSFFKRDQEELPTR